MHRFQVKNSSPALRSKEWIWRTSGVQKDSVWLHSGISAAISSWQIWRVLSGTGKGRDWRNLRRVVFDLFSKVEKWVSLKKHFKSVETCLSGEIWKHKMTTQSRPYLLSRGDEGNFFRIAKPGWGPHSSKAMSAYAKQAQMRRFFLKFSSWWFC